ncbi:MAG: hypothetical protein H6741_14425 [Alphaproteobacteria bacterium]|nr:hypothetical protein [Alphaproteobacteria bacterium]
MLDPRPRASSWQSALDAAQLREALERHALLQDGPLALTWKLSGAGIVGRVMDLPETERDFVGRRTPFGYELALSPEPGHRHAFEPIAELHLEGSQVDVLLRLHREQRSFALPFVLTGAACVVSAAVGAPGSPGMAAMALGLGLAFILLPPLRARSLFEAACARTLARLQGALELRARPG